MAEAIEQVKHTAVPFKCDGVGYDDRVYIESQDNGGNGGFAIARCRGPERAANAAFIVRACNAHDYLLEACRLALARHDAAMQQAKTNSAPRRVLELIDKEANSLRAAIAKAEGTTAP